MSDDAGSPAWSWIIHLTLVVITAAAAVVGVFFKRRQTHASEKSARTQYETLADNKKKTTTMERTAQLAEATRGDAAYERATKTVNRHGTTLADASRVSRNVNKNSDVDLLFSKSEPLKPKLSDCCDDIEAALRDLTKEQRDRLCKSHGQQFARAAPTIRLYIEHERKGHGGPSYCSDLLSFIEQCTREQTDTSS